MSLAISLDTKKISRLMSSNSMYAAPGHWAPVWRWSARTIFPPSECLSRSGVANPTPAKASPYPSSCMPLKKSWRALLLPEGEPGQMHDLRAVTHSTIRQACHLNDSGRGERTKQKAKTLHYTRQLTDGHCASRSRFSNTIHWSS